MWTRASLGLGGCAGRAVPDGLLPLPNTRTWLRLHACAWRVATQVTAPPCSSAGPSGSAAGAEGGGEGVPALRSSVAAQGTVALQGERTLWQAPRLPTERLKRRQPAPAAQQGPTTPAAAVASQPVAAAAAAGGALPNPAAQITVPVLTRSGQQASTGRPGPGPSSSMLPVSASESSSAADDSDDDEEDVASSPAAAAGWGVSSSPAQRHRHQQTRVAPLSPASGSERGAAPFGISLPNPGQVQEDLTDVTQRVSRMRDAVTQGARWVADGGIPAMTILQPAGSGAGAWTAGAACLGKGRWAGQRHGSRACRLWASSGTIEWASPLP